MAVYLPWVDLLRFVACVLVIYSHASLAATERVAFGHAGVALFFSISGYLIGSVLKNMYGQPNWYARFYVNRFLRIYPPLLAGLTFFGALAALGFANKPGTLEVFLRNVFYMATFTEPLSSDTWIPYGIVWTLCIEEWFYLMLPLIFAVVGPKRAIVVLIGLIVLTAEPLLSKLPGTDRGIWFVWPVNLLLGAVLALSNLPKRTGFPWLGRAGSGAAGGERGGQPVRAVRAGHGGCDDGDGLVVRDDRDPVPEAVELGVVCGQEELRDLLAPHHGSECRDAGGEQGPGRGDRRVGVRPDRGRSGDRAVGAGGGGHVAAVRGANPGIPQEGEELPGGVLGPARAAARSGAGGDRLLAGGALTLLVT
jgi:Predicted acyltransferases